MRSGPGWKAVKVGSTLTAGLVQKRQLPFVAPDARRGLADQALERPGQVGLIVVAGQVHGLADAGAVAQQAGGVAGALDLAVGAVRQAGGQAEVALSGAAGQGLRVAGQRGADGGVADQEAGPRQAGDQETSALSKVGYSQAV
jgi:hypothetical protein